MSRICFEFADAASCRFGDACRFQHITGTELEELINTGRWPQNDLNGSDISAPTAITVDHIAQFFASYPSFVYDASASFVDEFYKMCDVFDWDVGDSERQTSAFHLQRAMLLQFNHPDGATTHDIRSWQSLCSVLKVEPVPETVKECRKMALSTHVNICDVLAAPTEGKPCVFATEWELAAYSRTTGKIFPRDFIHVGSLVRFLLRRM